MGDGSVSVPSVTPTPVEIDTLAQCGILIRYAAENTGDTAKKATFATVVEAIEQCWEAQRKNTWTAANGASFWKAYNDLCTLISPVTADTLATNTTTIKSKRWFQSEPLQTTLPQRTVRRYIILFVFLLVSSVILSFLTSTATNLNTSVKTLITNTDPIADEVAKQLIILRSKQVIEFAAAPDAESQAAAAKATSSLAKLYANADQLYGKAAAASVILFEPFPICPPGKTPDGSYYCYELGGGDIALRIDHAQRNVDNYRLLARKASGRADDAQDRANFFTSTILPLLLGMTGASAYVIRTISDQIKTSSFSSTSPIRHFVRVTLGALAGVAIGFGGLFATTTVSSVALSFLAGYAIEPVFSTFDKIAAKF
jgi:hypothetical protein